MSDSSIYREFTKAREGGLSKAKTDSASKNPVPDGSGYHTNKGITWELFESLGAKLKYTPTPELFYEMPDWLFDLIYEERWNTSGANLINSQPIAQLVFQSLWGGGHDELVESIQRYFKGKLKVDGDLGNYTANAINDFTSNKTNEFIFHQYVYDSRMKYLQSLKAFKANGKGWTARMIKLFNFNIELLKGK